MLLFPSNFQISQHSKIKQAYWRPTKDFPYLSFINILYLWFSCLSNVKTELAQQLKFHKRSDHYRQVASCPSISELQINHYVNRIQNEKLLKNKGNPLTLLVGMQTSTATMENSVEIP